MQERVRKEKTKRKNGKRIHKGFFRGQRGNFQRYVAWRRRRKGKGRRLRERYLNSFPL